MKLDLRGNDIQELPTGAFKHTPYLTHLSLQRCNIRRVKEGAFRGLGRLVFLNLANNNIDILYQVVTHTHEHTHKENWNFKRQFIRLSAASSGATKGFKHVNTLVTL